jgi:hypothetical protein
MTSHPFPCIVSPDPRYLLLLAIATPNRLERFQRDLHLLQYIRLDEWSVPQPTPDCAEKQLIVVNRLMP